MEEKRSRFVLGRNRLWATIAGYRTEGASGMSDVDTGDVGAGERVCMMVELIRMATPPPRPFYRS